MRSVVMKKGAELKSQALFQHSAVSKGWIMTKNQVAGKGIF